MIKQTIAALLLTTSVAAATDSLDVGIAATELDFNDYSISGSKLSVNMDHGPIEFGVDFSSATDTDFGEYLDIDLIDLNGGLREAVNRNLVISAGVNYERIKFTTTDFIDTATDTTVYIAAEVKSSSELVKLRFQIEDDSAHKIEAQLGHDDGINVVLGHNDYSDHFSTTTVGLNYNLKF